MGWERGGNKRLGYNLITIKAGYNNIFRCNNISDKWSTRANVKVGNCNGAVARTCLRPLKRSGRLVRVARMKPSNSYVYESHRG